MGYLVLTELFLPTKGGTAVWFDEVYRRLGGADTHVVTADVPGAQDHDASHPNTIHRLRLRPLRWVRPSSAGIYLKLLIRSVFLGMRHRFEAVHAGRVLPEGYVGWVVARVIRKPFLVYAHGEEITTWKRYPRRRRLMQFTYQRATVIVANSDFTRKELLRLDIDPRRIVVIHPGVDVLLFNRHCNGKYVRRRLGIGVETRLILSVGRLSPRKGFDQVIAALPHLVRKGLDVRYAVIGIGADADRLLSLAKSHQVEDRVQFLGHIEAAELPHWYAAADLFAMPNRDIDGDTEGFGMVYIEAAACGTTAVAGRAGGTGAAVLDEKTGLRVDGEDLKSIETVLARLLLNDKLRLELSENAYIRAHQQFSWESVAQKTRELLESHPTA